MNQLCEGKITKSNRTLNNKYNYGNANEEPFNIIIKIGHPIRDRHENNRQYKKVWKLLSKNKMVKNHLQFVI